MSYAQYCRLNVHVHASAMHVIRKARERLTHASARDPKLRTQRKAYYRAMLEQHSKAKALFVKYRF